MIVRSWLRSCRDSNLHRRSVSEDGNDSRQNVQSAVARHTSVRKMTGGGVSDAQLLAATDVVQ